MKAIILLYLGLEFNSNTFSLCFTLCSCEKMNADQVIKKLSLFRRLTGAAACNLRLLVSEPYAYVIQK